MGRAIRLDEDIYGVTELRESLPQVVDKAAETKRPMVITKHGRPVAAIIDIGELQHLYDELEELEAAEDRAVVREFEAAEARGEVGWLSDEEMGSFIDDVVARSRKRA
ncbi:MAG: type II toxin-antitoxin system Phd/YefM family antitoxin [Chloroflexota bacterium]